MRDDLRADLVGHYLEYAEAAARRRDWTEVLDLAEDILILDPDHPTALTLRYLQTLVEISTEKNSTTIFPVPIDLLRPFLEGAGREK